jgi:predicted nucleic-acid-binding protein
MLGVDTNILVRYLVGDDRSQYERARRLIHRQEEIGEPVLVSLWVLLEMEWVLRSRYGLAKPDIAAAFSSLLQTAESFSRMSPRWSTRFSCGRTRPPNLPTA